MQIPPCSASAFQACRNIDAIAKDVVVLDDDVAEIDPDPEPDPAFLGDRGCAIGHRELPFGGTAHRVYDAREFRQYPVASGVDDAAGVLADLRVDDFASMRLQAFVRAFLVRAPTSEARIAARRRTAGINHPALKFSAQFTLKLSQIHHMDSLGARRFVQPRSSPAAAAASAAI